jgi:hypothetical protein
LTLSIETSLSMTASAPTGEPPLMAAGRPTTCPCRAYRIVACRPSRETANTRARPERMSAMRGGSLAA